MSIIYTILENKKPYLLDRFVLPISPGPLFYLLINF